mmetsp:Transcript_104746/g.292289  ORF Transcript_104746/g.292289 Transcript_104746/m.292289 type:complete len:324 (+) Transcript_104746:80-1051(+)
MPFMSCFMSAAGPASRPSSPNMGTLAKGLPPVDTPFAPRLLRRRGMPTTSIVGRALSTKTCSFGTGYGICTAKDSLMTFCCRAPDSLSLLPVSAALPERLASLRSAGSARLTSPFKIGSSPPAASARSPSLTEIARGLVLFLARCTCARESKAERISTLTSSSSSVSSQVCSLDTSRLSFSPASSLIASTISLYFFTAFVSGSSCGFSVTTTSRESPLDRILHCSTGMSPGMSRGKNRKLSFSSVSHSPGTTISGTTTPAGGAARPTRPAAQSHGAAAAQKSATAHPEGGLGGSFIYAGGGPSPGQDEGKMSTNGGGEEWGES